jgi:hypothetical protein
MMKPLKWLALPGLTCLAACSAVSGDAGKVADASTTGGRCMGTPLQSHRVIDRQTLLIEDSWGRSALLHMGSQCLLDDISPLKFTYNIGGSSICDRSDLTVTWGIDQAVPVTCIVSSVQPLSREEAKAYNAPEAKKF